MTFRMAFQHAGRTGFDGALGRVGARLGRGPYSHTELVFSDGRCGTAMRKEGVVLRPRHMDPTQWDFLQLGTAFDEHRALLWYEAHKGQRYDVRGNFHFLTSLVSHNENEWFCTESNFAALRIPDAWRYEPNGAYVLIEYLIGRLECCTAKA